MPEKMQPVPAGVLFFGHFLVALGSILSHGKFEAIDRRCGSVCKMVMPRIDSGSYGHVMTDEKIAAQGSMLERMMPKTVVVQ